jgi:hypothetical protein
VPTLVDEFIHRYLDRLDTMYWLRSIASINVIYAFMNIQET